MYDYQATLMRVVDGDTIDVLVDLGFHMSVEMRLRLAGIDTPELHSPDDALRARAVRARARVIELLPLGVTFRVETIKDKTEKYGRYLAWITPAGATATLNAMLVSEGLAKEYSGGER